MFIADLINNLYSLLTIDVSKHRNISLIRRHTKKLNTLGELSFPLDIINWKHVLSPIWHDNATISTILEYIAKNDKEFSLQSMCDKVLTISKADIMNSNVHLYLHRLQCFKHGIKETLDQNERYGSCNMNLSINIKTDLSNEGCLEDLNISKLRIMKLKEVAHSLLLFNNCTISENPNDYTIVFTHKSSNISEKNVVLINCAPVLITSSNKESPPNATDYYNQRTIDMRLMAEHKYGVRISSQEGWKEFFKKLGNSAVMIELMENKPSHSLKLNLSDPTLSSQKNASFIMYNCARLAAIFKEFHKRSISEIYPELPDFDNIDFDLLKEPEEWELLFVYVLQFPCVLKNTIKDIQEGKFNPHYLVAFLSGLASTFSVYYRRVKILNEPKTHLFPIMFARIYLLKAVERILHNALNLLNIEPVSQM